MSQPAVPYRDAHKMPSERYREDAAANRRVAPPREYLIERDCELVMEGAYDDGRKWSFEGKKKDPRRAGIPAWCVEAWCAGYDAATRETERHAATRAAV